MIPKTLFIVADHAGFELKEHLKNTMAHACGDLGTTSHEKTDYPDQAQALANELRDNPTAYGILICGSGMGMAIAANRHSHIRAALCRSSSDAAMARKHNDANVLVLGSKETSPTDALRIIEAFLSAEFEGGRHATRVEKLMKSTQDDALSNQDEEISSIINHELKRQQNTIELIASENFTSRAVLAAQGSILTNKYAEGYPRKRYYGGCEFVDSAEELAIERLKKIYGAAFANVQPHSGSQANQAVFLALMNPGDTFLGMSLDAGGHLTHGCKVNMSGKWFNAVNYGVRQSDGLIDIAEVEKLAHQHKPKIIIAGGSAYPRKIDFAAFRAIADSVGAYFMVDMAHFSGLVAGGVFPNPVPHAHVVTSTTHKTLRGPRGGIILTNDEAIAKKVNSAIFPGMQGGPLMHVIAAKAVAFKEALAPTFKQYCQQIIDNAKALAATLQERGYTIFTGGTDCHLLLVDLRPQKITGKDAERVLEESGLTCNKNSIPFDTEKPFITSGIRLGTPACTTRGFRQQEFIIVGNLIADTLDQLATGNPDPSIQQRVKAEVAELCKNFSLYD